MSEAAALTGVCVAVTRPRRQAGALVAALEARGARVLACPLIRIEAAEDPQPLRIAARAVAQYDDVVFTSANAVDRFSRALHEAGTTLRNNARVAAIGPATAAAVRSAGLQPAIEPHEATGQALARALADAGAWHERRVLFPRAREASSTVADALRALGASVHEVECYRTVRDAGGAAELHARLRRGEVDAIAFTSPSQVYAFADQLGAGAAPALLIAVIGPVTAAAVRQRGFDVAVEAPTHTAAGLAQALASHVAAARASTGGAAPSRRSRS